MQDLERVLEEIRVEHARSGQPLTRRFIVAEGLSENYGDIVDLPRIVELKKKYKYRLILDENWSFGVLGSHGRGVTEYFGVVPSEVDMIIGSMATTLCGGGGFCAGSKEVVDHQVAHLKNELTLAYYFPRLRIQRCSARHPCSNSFRVDWYPRKSGRRKPD